MTKQEAEKFEGLYKSASDGRTYKIFDFTLKNKINNSKEDFFHMTCLNCTTKSGNTRITEKNLKRLIGFELMIKQ